MAIEKLVLGTVQLGMKYGINNKGDKVNRNESFSILKTAFTNRIRCLDTADRYGDAADVIGAFHKSNPDMRFDVITKFEYQLGLNLADWLNVTLTRLHVDCLYGCMSPIVEDKKLNNYLLEQLLYFKNKRLINHIGYSLYTNDELSNIINDNRISLVQLPFNLLDNKNLRQSIFHKAREAGKIIHTRSVFLQGLFFLDVQKLPEYLKPLTHYLKRINEIASLANLSVTELALGYALDNDCINGVLIGVDNVSQLVNNIKATNIILSRQTIKEIDDIIVETSHLLDPRIWK